MNIPIANFPLNPDAEEDPKRTLVNIVRSKGSRKLKADIVPLAGIESIVGAGYLTQIEAMAKVWRPDVAAQNSDSLRRCLKALEVWQ